MIGVLGYPEVLLRVSVPPLPILAIALTVWMYHWRVIARDRLLVGERGAASTLRRWYTYAFALIGLILLVSGAQTALMSTWLRLSSAHGGFAVGVAGAAEALIGLALWAVHWAWLPRSQEASARQEEERSILRTVYLFLALALTLVGTLSGLSQALYYALARLLGIGAPGGVAGPLLDAAAGPVSVVIVYGIAWMYQRSAVSEAAYQVEVPRQVGVRRIYTYLTALVALAVLAVGLAGLVWIYGDLLTQATGILAADWWRDRLSLFATLIMIGLPVWLFHGRAGEPAEARSLARRIYLFVALIGAMLGLLGSGAAAVYRLLSLALGSSNVSGVSTELSHAIAIALVAAGVAAYHWRAIRDDGRRAPAMTQLPAQVVVELRAPTAEVIDQALESLRSQGISVHRRAA